ncbi:hypothetical protein [Pseudonocardia sp. Ae717_Ps2]|uniref:hypothetical protein n=1 Tax=Pseudonocardia sp. Ae717_Ps2 TaxID=1885573 RepID=UPI00117B7157|nr:hypothetical protein [Pseudonocardia sp. Ae717_Ps2]
MGAEGAPNWAAVVWRCLGVLEGVLYGATGVYRRAVVLLVLAVIFLLSFAMAWTIVDGSFAGALLS